MTSSYDLVQGIFTGLALGDALGAPHEFRYQVPIRDYTGNLIHPVVISSRWQGRKVGNIGQITDDTEMTIALIEAIIEGEGHYNPDLAVLSYQRWANSGSSPMSKTNHSGPPPMGKANHSGPPPMGKNTRALFKGVVTLKGYMKRRDKLLKESEHSASNGCLMRCSPLALLSEDEWLEATISDCSLSNFPDVCRDSVVAYVCTLRALLDGNSAEEATTKALRMVSVIEVREVIIQGRDGLERDVSKNKGWILHSLYCAFFALNSKKEGFQDRIDEVIRMRGDTDTNGAITGALLGAQVGLESMKAESRTRDNIDIILSYNPEEGELARPVTYSVGRLMELVDILYG